MGYVLHIMVEVMLIEQEILGNRQRRRRNVWITCLKSQ
jgi:hypothetical protein